MDLMERQILGETTPIGIGNSGEANPQGVVEKSLFKLLDPAINSKVQHDNHNERSQDQKE